MLRLDIYIARKDGFHVNNLYKHTLVEVYTKISTKVNLCTCKEVEGNSQVNFRVRRILTEILKK